MNPEREEGYDTCLCAHERQWHSEGHGRCLHDENCPCEGFRSPPAPNPEREDAVELDGRERRLIEIIFGPCSRKEAEDVVLHVQETLDDTYPELGGATALHFGLDAASQSMAVPVSSADEREWTLMPGRGYTPTRTTVETETHIPVVPKSTLLVALARIKELEGDA